MADLLQIDQMTLEEKIRAMEALWDDLCRRDEVPMSKWQKNLLDERERLVKQGKARFSDWALAKARISKKTS